MKKKIINCNEITFETVKDILTYKKVPIDISWKITPECVEEIKGLNKKLDEVYKQLNEYTEKYAETNVMDAANAILAKLDHIDEENQICQDALKMNSLMQGEHLTTSNIEDIDDEAEDILKREAPEKLCEVATDEKHDLLGEGEEQIKVDFDFEDEGKAKPDEIERLENLNKDNPNCIDLTSETQK